MWRSLLCFDGTHCRLCNMLQVVSERASASYLNDEQHLEGIEGREEGLYLGAWL